MRFRIFCIAISCVTLLAVTSCNSCSDSKKKYDGGTVNEMVQQLDETPDSAIVFYIEDFDADSLYGYPRTTGKKMSLSYQQAMGSGMVKGSIKRCHLYSIFPETARKSVIIAINISELSKHDWIYDQQNMKGFKFNTKGGMSSINNNDICFREWKLLNGKLYLYYVGAQQHADDRTKYEVEEAEIVELSEEHLVLSFKGRTYDCQKPSDKPLLLKHAK